ncbi:site-2 protease family protein [Roseibacterium sp. SDUM158017]|uniref:site-2 protease family protein n=1 Tax=Roseicyclus salinarum TaxID=3036773 RepID=UPI00241530AF|nr:site-2 protease family protein [Roseibacterium sp. SDUM158017]MDG4647793.1 site-2 protease family protein [Roseibacterium sp. SDUM158017]
MLTKRFELFTLLGFRVSLDLSWFIIAVLVTWSLATGYFPEIVAGLEPATAWWLGTAGALGLFASIILHEFAHAIVARRFDIPMRGITLFIFGGVAEMENEPPSARSEFFMAIAGPIMSFALSGVFYAVSLLSPGQLSEALFGYLALINLILAVFNLVPAFPLDGGRVFRAAVWGWTGDYAKATRIGAGLGRFFGVLLIMLGVANLIGGSSVAGIWQALIGLFIISAAGSSEAQMTLRTGLENRTVGQLMVRDPISIDAGTPLTSVIEDYFYRHHHTMFPVTRNGRLAGCLRIEDVGGIPAADRAELRAGDILPEGGGRVPVVAPGMAAEDALGVMQSNRTSRLLVAENGVLAGILTLRDVMAFLTIRQELARREAAPRARSERAA